MFHIQRAQSRGVFRGLRMPPPFQPTLLFMIVFCCFTNFFFHNIQNLDVH